MDNPTKYLKDYLGRNHNGLRLSVVRQEGRERAVYCWGHVKMTSGHWDFRIMIPRSAPENGRPLCTCVKHNGKEVWNFVDNHKVFQGVRQKFRVHLYEFSVGRAKQFALVEVLEGTPDQITRIYRVDGDEFSLEVESLFKSQVGRLWGMRVHWKQAERESLNRLLQPRGK